MKYEMHSSLPKSCVNNLQCQSQDLTVIEIKIIFKIINPRLSAYKYAFLLEDLIRHMIHNL